MVRADADGSSSARATGTGGTDPEPIPGEDGINARVCESSAVWSVRLARRSMRVITMRLRSPPKRTSELAKAAMLWGRWVGSLRSAASSTVHRPGPMEAGSGLGGSAAMAATMPAVESPSNGWVFETSS